MRTILSIVLMAAFVASGAFGQAGPGRKDPPKKKTADTTRAASAKPDTTPPAATKVPMSRVKEFEKAQQPKPKGSAKPEEQVKAPVEAGRSDHVPRAVLCVDIENREPVGAIDSIVADVDTVCFFTEIVGLAGTTVTHRWKHGDEVRAEVPISIGGPHWRVYSRKALMPEWTGRWTVEVVDADTRVLARKEFVYRRKDG